MRWVIPITISVIILLILTACSSGEKNPVEPGTNQAEPAVQEMTGNSQSPPEVNTELLGYYDIFFDPDTCTLEAVENRTAEFTLNLVPLLNNMPSPNYGISFGSISIDQTVPGIFGIDVAFIIHHPVPGIPQFNAYDVFGVIVGNGGAQLEYDSLNYAEHGIDLWMKNPDGYSRWFNPPEFTSNNFFGYFPGGYQNLAGTANLNPYKYYCKGLDAEEDLWDFLTGPVNNDGVFETSGRMMELDFVLPPDGIGIRFGYAVVIEWEDQGGGPYTPWNKTEAVAHSTIQTDNLYYNHADGSGGCLIADVSLFSWEEQPDTIIVESSVLDTAHLFAASTIGTEIDENVWTYHIDVPSDPFIGNDDHWLWVIAEYDSFDYHNGLPATIAPDAPLAAFFHDPLYVGTEGTCEVEVLSITPDQGMKWQHIPDAVITCTEIVDGPDLDAYLTDGTDTIYGTNITWVDTETITADFDLAAGGEGMYDLVVHDGVCPVPGMLEDAFEILPCATNYIGVEPSKGMPDTTPTLMIEIDPCIDAGFFAATLKMTGETDILGTTPTYVDDTHFSADFDLTGAALGDWDLEVVNGCGGDFFLAAAAFEVFEGGDIMQTDVTPISTGLAAVPGDLAFDEAIDIACKSSDGGFYIAWSQAGYLVGGYVDRYDADGATVLMHALCDPQGSDDIYFFYERVGLDCGSVGSSNGWACVVDPVIHFGNDETNTDGENDSYGYWYGSPNWWTDDSCNPSTDNCYSYANYNDGDYTTITNEHYYGGDWDNFTANWLQSILGADPDGRENSGEMPFWRTNIIALGMGQDRDDLWSLCMAEPHVKKYTDYLWTTLEGTEFGANGTADGQIAEWTDSGTPDYKRLTGPVDITVRGIMGQTRIYVLDEPASGIFRIQCFDDTGAFLATSNELGCADFGGATQAYRMDYHEFYDVMYVLFDNNMLIAFIDTTI